jgi:sec-independent protein translocase protein TatA
VGELSAWHWAIVAVVAMLLFGSRRLPDAARSIGRSARILRAELRAGTDSGQDEVAGGPGPGDRDPAGDADRPAEPARRPSAS